MKIHVKHGSLQHKTIIRHFNSSNNNNDDDNEKRKMIVKRKKKKLRAFLIETFPHKETKMVKEDVSFLLSE